MSTQTIILVSQTVPQSILIQGQTPEPSLLEALQAFIPVGGDVSGKLDTEVFDDFVITNQEALDEKVDKVTGKGLSTEDYSTTEKAKLAAISGSNTGDETASTIKTKLGVTTLSGSNTGDQDLTGLIHTNRTALDNVSGVNTGDNATNSQYSGLSAQIQDLTPVHYSPSTMTVNTGTLSQGSVGSLTAVGGTDIIVTEVTGADPLRVTFTATGVQRLTSLSFYGRYAGGANHTLNIEAYNNTTTSWDLLGTIGTSTAKQWYSFNLFLPNNYLNSGSVQVRLVHQGNGIAGHQLILDYLDINYGGAGGSTFVTASGVSYVAGGNIVATSVQGAIQELDSEKQATLQSGVNIKTINNLPILGAGNITIEGGSGGGVPYTGATQSLDLNTQYLMFIDSATGLKIRMGVRGDYIVFDKELTALGFAGEESFDGVTGDWTLRTYF